MVEAVLFDLDGTLLDRDASVRAFVSDQHDRITALHHIPKHEYVARFVELDRRGRVWKDEVYRTLVAELGIRACGWQELLRDYEEGFRRSCVPVPGLRTVLEALKADGYRLGIVSNGREAFQNAVVRALGIERYLDAVLISETERIRKPEGDIFRRALMRLGASPERGVHVGDDPEAADVMGAKRAGLRAVWKRSAHWERSPDCDAVVGELEELTTVLRRFG